MCSSDFPWSHPCVLTFQYASMHVRTCTHTHIHRDILNKCNKLFIYFFNQYRSPQSAILMFWAQAEPWVILLELVDLAETLLLQKEFQVLFYCFGPSSNFQPTGQECSTRCRVQGCEIRHSYCPLGARSSGSDCKDAGIQLYYKTVLSYSYPSKWLQSW